MNGEWMDAVDSCVQDLDTMMLGAQGDQSKGSKLLKSNESWLPEAPKNVFAAKGSYKCIARLFLWMVDVADKCVSLQSWYW